MRHPDPLSAPFRPAWWLPSPHLQTLWAAAVRRRPRLALRRERLELPDGDFLDLDWVAGTPGPAGSRGAESEPVDSSTRGARGGAGQARPGEGAPVVLVLHGLEGSSDSHYARGLLAAVRDLGWTGVLMHFRACSGEPNRLPRSYHSGETGDTAHVAARLRARLPGRPLAVVGYSLGGNVLLKWLGQAGREAPVECAVAVSVPFELGAAAERLERGFSRLYQWWLLRSLARSLLDKVARGTLPPAYAAHARARDFRSFDDAVTAPLHGFAGVDDYYGRSSSRQYLGGIRVPTLILHALDDPFLVPEAVPAPSEVASEVTLEVYPRGGHVGFVAGPWPWRAEYWLERRIPAFIADRTSPPAIGPP